jgi:sulfatase maturation enzyme AslB (radical SAM superfamily)
MKSLTVSVWPGCNNACVMCTNAPAMRRMSRWPFSLYKLMENLEDKKAASVVITGGEPTLNNYLLRFIKWLRDSRGARHITLLTNGRKFSSAAYARRFLSVAPKAHLAVSLPAGVPALHDAVTRVKGSFMETSRGLRNIAALKSPEQALEARIVLTARNAAKAGATVKWLLANIPGLDFVTLVYPEYEGAMQASPELAITYGQCLPALEAAALAAKDFDGLRFYHFPHCVLPRALRRFALRSLSSEELHRGAACAKCAASKDCGGVPLAALPGNPDFKFRAIACADGAGRRDGTR